MPKKTKKRILEEKAELELLLERLGYTVVIGRGSFKEGTCVVMQDKKIVINQFTPPDLQIGFLIKALQKIDLSDVYVRPALRDLIETW